MHIIVAAVMITSGLFTQHIAWTQEVVALVISEELMRLAIHCDYYFPVKQAALATSKDCFVRNHTEASGLCRYKHVKGLPVEVFVLHSLSISLLPTRAS